mmetsp:Transcript_15370/g.42146  ORF Transcript_15370/g.42146 Transcript_15370/m.42146 type:complete len:279 (+) Transcript_15370:613-1449(+)
MVSTGIGGNLFQWPTAGEKHSALVPSCVPSRPPTTYNRPWTTAAAHRERAVAIGGSDSHTPIAGSNRSTTFTTFLPSCPPTTYSWPLKAAAAQPYRGVGMDGKACHCPVPVSSRSAVAKAGDASFFPPNTYTSGGILLESLGSDLLIMASCAVESWQMRRTALPPAAVPTATANSGTCSTSQKPPPARRILKSNRSALHTSCSSACSCLICLWSSESSLCLSRISSTASAMAWLIAVSCLSCELCSVNNGCNRELSIGSLEAGRLDAVSSLILNATRP